MTPEDEERQPPFVLSVLFIGKWYRQRAGWWNGLATGLSAAPISLATTALCLAATPPSKPPGGWPNNRFFFTQESISMKKGYAAAVAFGAAAVPLLVLAALYPSLPTTVPLHFGADLQPDRFGSKTEVWLVTALLSVLSIGVYFLFANLHRFDPKQRGKALSPRFQQLGLGMVVFMAMLNLLLLFLVKGSTVAQSVLFPLVGLLFAFTGYVLNGIPPNYVAGFRLPWTLNNDENWRKTHRFGGRLWLAGGVLTAVVCLLLPLSFYSFLAITGAMVCIPCIYSYRLFKHEA